MKISTHEYKCKVSSIKLDLNKILALIYLLDDRSIITLLTKGKQI